MNGIDEAIAALRAGAYSQAAEILDAAGAGKPGAAPRARMLWAIAQVMCRNFESETADAILDSVRRAPNRAVPIYQKVLSLTGPLDALLPAEAAQEIRLRIGDYFLREEKADEAMAWLAAACAAAPEDPIAIYLEANCRFVLYGERQAVRDMESILERAAADTQRAYFVGGRTAAFWYRLGLAHDRMKNLEEANGYFAKAVELDPDNETPRVMLGDVLIRLHRFDEAIAQLAPIQKFADGYRYAARLRAIALFRLGNAEAALSLLEELAEFDPLAASTFLEMGRIHLARGDIEQAEFALARAFRINPDLPGLKAAIVTAERHLGRHMDPDAGLPEPTGFTIPEEFAPRPDDRALYEKPSLRAACNSFMRVLHTLIIRDMLVLDSHSGIGYLWSLAQPLTFTGTLAVVYLMAGHHVPLGTSAMAYLAAGVIPYVSFYVRVEAAVASSVRSNVSLLYFRDVTPLVLIAATVVRETLTSLVVFVIIIGGIACYDDTVQINDPLTILAALSCISLLGMIVGTVFGLGELAIPSLKLAEVVVFRLMFFFSGALYYANLIPPRMRYFALFNPLLHLIEFVRNSVFVNYHSRYANWHYPLEFIGIGLAVVMVLLHSTRRYVVAA